MVWECTILQRCAPFFVQSRRLSRCHPSLLSLFSMFSLFLTSSPPHTLASSPSLQLSVAQIFHPPAMDKWSSVALHSAPLQSTVVTEDSSLWELTDVSARLMEHGQERHPLATVSTQAMQQAANPIGVTMTCFKALVSAENKI